jgi:hypothetical protein
MVHTLHLSRFPLCGRPCEKEGEFSRLSTETKRAEEILAALRPLIPAEVLQICELDSCKFAAVRSLDISSPLFLPCHSIIPHQKLYCNSAILRQYTLEKRYRIMPVHCTCPASRHHTLIVHVKHGYILIVDIGLVLFSV